MGEVERTMEQGSAPVSKGPEIEWRDRLLAALLNQEGEFSLLGQDSDEAHLIGLTTPQQVVLLTVRNGAEKNALSTGVKRILKGLKHGDPVHFVAVGGGSEAARLMKRAAPTFQTRTMGFHHVSSDGTYKRLMGQKLAALPRASANLATTGPPTPAALAAARGASVEHMARESNAIAKLGGSYRVTATIVGACVILGGLSYFWGPGGLHRVALWRMGANNGDAIRNGEVFRLFASTFLHVDVVHLIVNMIALLSLGPLLEALTGPRRYLLLYAASGMGGALASALLRPQVLGVGASGAIWGLMTACLGISLRPRGLLPPLMAKRMQSRLWGPLVINALYSFRPGIDLLAHAGGGVVGFLLATTLLTRGLTPLEERSRWAGAEREGEGGLTIAAITTVLAMVASIAVGVISGRPWTLDDALALERVRIANTSISLALPKLVARDAFYAETKQGDARIFSYGNLHESPVAFEIVVTELPEQVPAEQFDLAMEENRKALDTDGPFKAQKSGSATRVKAGKHEAVRVAHRLGSIELLSYFVLAGRYAVLVRGYCLPPRPSTWASAEETVASSIISGSGASIGR